MSKRRPVSLAATKRLTWKRGDIQITPPKKPPPEPESRRDDAG